MNVPEVGIDELIERYDALLIDAYGVLVDGHGAIDGAVELVAELERRRKPFAVVTNDASRLPATSAEWYQKAGLAIAADRVVTSGSLLVPYFRRHELVGARCLVLGPEDSAQYVADAGGRVVEVDGSANFDLLVLCDESGYPFLDWLDAALTSLIRRLDASEPVHLVLPNPDLLYPKGRGAFGIAIGSIARMMERILADRYPNRLDLRFVRLGKPFAPIFEEAVRRIGSKHVVMIGDQLSTDIRGATDFGLDSALVESGLTRRKECWRSDELRPTYVIRSVAP